MSFARQRLYGTNHERPAVFPPFLPRRKIAARRFSSRRLAAALKPAATPAGSVAAIALAASCAAPAHAKSAQKPTGVWAWTSGSQTYIRARPSATTPPIAKVARHTKLFVWGKFDGWYRVETTDHKFGWIFNTYLHPTSEDKIAELSHRKAKLASDRTEDQTMYGSAQLLKKHYARYGAEGARVGLQKQGVIVASTRAKAPRVAAKKVVARPTVKVTPRTVQAVRKNGGSRVVQVAEKAAVRTPRVVHPRTASVDNASTRGQVLRPVGVFPGASTRDDNRLNRSPDGTIDLNDRRAAPDETPAETAAPAIADNSARDANVKRTADARRDAARRAAIRAEEARLIALRAENARLEKQRVQEQQRLANVQRDAQAKRDAQQNRLVEAQRAAANEASRQAAAQKAANSKRAAEQARLYAARQKEAARLANAARRRATYLAKLKARQDRKKLYASRKANQREALRQRMGMASVSPQAAEQGLRPLSPEELLRARDQYLSSRHKTRPAMPQPKKAPAKKPAASTRGDNLFEKTPPGSAFNNRHSALPQSVLSKTSGATFQLASYAISRSPFDAPIAAPKLCAPAAKPAAKTPPQNALNSRGGSPRDYMLNGRNALGKSVATQALSYRGMPYIRGASSSKRGFDCSGLIYFLLRQRGYKPPRTAAQLASYGTRVEKKDLQAGDILLFRNTTRRGGISHVGIYTGDGKFVHAANPRRGVRTDSLGSGYYARKFAGARRIK